MFLCAIIVSQSVVGQPERLGEQPTVPVIESKKSIQPESLEFVEGDQGEYRMAQFRVFVLIHASEAFGIERSRCLIRYGYYHGLPTEKAKVYTRFETAGPGMLFQHDSSLHAWLPATGRQQSLILTQDDYSRLVVGARLVERETAWSHLQTVKETVHAYGRALAYYVDHHSFFHPYGTEGEPQFTRALRTLGIGVIYASGPEAKGKIEKRFDYFQRRLPFLCEKQHITTLAAAIPVLQERFGWAF